MANKYNIHLIKSRSSYSIKDIATLLNVDRKTCSRWIKKENLKVVDEDSSPLLIMGEDLKIFINPKRSAKKKPLAKNQFYCFKCKKVVEALNGSENIVKTGKRIGKNKIEQQKKIGLCEQCGTKINRFLKICQKD